ncbi:unnamed protein product [Polarella glacialis]|uniref:Uncharacterized protein n=1 Tax=Polarella glacialis TaxID=89957 RepID=A0A813L1A1_POLGL|nr:unnamed protein product [Polarella glacialis]
MVYLGILFTSRVPNYATRLLLLFFLAAESQDNFCPELPAPEDHHFEESTRDFLGKRFAQCSHALDLAGPHGQQLLPSFVLADFPDVPVSSPELLKSASVCQNPVHAFRRVFLSPRYLLAIRAAECARAATPTSGWLQTGACIPESCTAVFSNLVIPRLFEWRSRESHPEVLPSAGPCAAQLLDYRGNSSDPLVASTWLRENDVACRMHLLASDSSVCAIKGNLWRLLSNKGFFNKYFGAQVRSLSSEGLGNPDSTVAFHQQLAIDHYRSCRQGGGDYVGVAFSDADFHGYELGMCVPSGLHRQHGCIRYWLGRCMSVYRPEVTIDDTSVVVTDLAHREEIDVQWAIIGVGRSGTTSLARWLGQHPRLELLQGPADICAEGSLEYLFRRTDQEHLINREWLGPPRRKSRPGQPQPLRGIKEPSLLRNNRGREMLAEMRTRRFIVLTKDWIEWMKSSLLYPTRIQLDDKGQLNCGPTKQLLLFLNRSGFAECDPINWQSSYVAQNLADLERKGVAVSSIKVLHLENLRSEGPGAIGRLAAWLGAGPANRSTLPPMPRENVVATSGTEGAFWAELCSLSAPLMWKLEQIRRKAQGLLFSCFGPFET